MNLRLTVEGRSVERLRGEVEPGDQALSVVASSGCFQIDLAHGRPISDLSERQYGERLIDHANGGTEPCDKMPTPGPAETSTFPTNVPAARGPGQGNSPGTGVLPDQGAWPSPAPEVVLGPGRAPMIPYGPPGL